MTDNDKRLIEDYLPIQAISAEAAREKSVRKGHAPAPYLWWSPQQSDHMKREVVASRCFDIPAETKAAVAAKRAIE